MRLGSCFRRYCRKLIQKSIAVNLRAWENELTQNSVGMGSDEVPALLRMQLSVLMV